MTNYAAYLVLVCCVVSTVFTGRRWALYAAAALMPMTQSLPTPVPFLSAAINLLLIGIIALRFLHTKPADRPQGPTPLRRVIGLIVLAILVGLSIRGFGTLGGHDYLLPFGEAFKNTWYWITPFLLYWLVFGLATTDEESRRVILIAQVSMACECLITIPELLQYGRASAHLLEPNQAGTYFASASAFFLARFLMGQGKAKWLFLIAWLVATNAVFNSLSRGAMLASALTGAVVALLFFFNPKSSTSTKFLFVGLIVLMGINFALVVPQKVKDRVLLTFGGAVPDSIEADKLDVSSEERLLYWSIALQLYKDQPFGYGAFTFPEMMYAYNTQDEHKAAHNIFLQVLVEHGIQGLVALLLLVVTVSLCLLRIYVRNRSPESQSLSLALFGWWMAHSVAHFLVNSFFLVLVSGQFWMMLACFLAMDQRAARATENAPVRSPAWNAAIAAAANFRRSGSR